MAPMEIPSSGPQNSMPRLSFATAGIPKGNFGTKGEIQTLSEPRNPLPP